MDYPQIVTTITEGLAPISSIVDAPWVSVTSLNGMTGDVIVEPIIKPFQSNHYYLKDGVITHDGAICFAKQTFTSGESFNPSDWDMPDFTQEQADWNENDSTAKSYIKNKPAIPTVNNGTLTIQRNGTNIATFSANTATNATANIPVPTKTSEITNDSDFITSNDIPTVNNATLTIQKNATTIDSFTANSSTNKTVNITVPTDTGDLTNNAGYLKATDIYPVGSIVTFYDTADHSNFLGLTWTRFAGGRMVVGYNSSDTAFDTIGKTGGEKTHTLTVNEMPNHTHTISSSGGHNHNANFKEHRIPTANYNGTSDYARKSGASKDSTGQVTISDGAHTHTPAKTGGGEAHNNMPPYIVAALWRRTA